MPDPDEQGDFWLRAQEIAAATIRRAVAVARWVTLYLVPPALLLASWIYRLELGAWLANVWTTIAIYLDWFGALPWRDQAFYGGLLLVFLLEVWYIDFKLILHGMLWRSLFPDLELERSPSRAPNFLGRLYRLEAPTREGEPYRYHFAPHYLSSFHLLRERIAGQPLHVLEHAAAPRYATNRRAVLPGLAIVADPARPRVWRVDERGMHSHAVGADTVNEIVADALRSNREIVREGVEGNPWVLAQRASKDTSSRVIPVSWRGRGPGSSTRSRSPSSFRVKVQPPVRGENGTGESDG